LETGYIPGFNDENLKVIENYSEAPVLSQSDELSVTVKDVVFRHKFPILVDGLFFDSGNTLSSSTMIRRMHEISIISLAKMVIVRNPLFKKKIVQEYE